MRVILQAVVPLAVPLPAAIVAPSRLRHANTVTGRAAEIDAADIGDVS